VKRKDWMEIRESITLYESLGIAQTTNVLTMSNGSNRKKKTRYVV